MSKFGKKQNIYSNYQRNLISATVSNNFGINNEQKLVRYYGEGVSRVDLLHKLRIQSKFTLYWFLIFTILGLVCLILDPTNWFNVLDLYIVMLNIYLMAKGKVIGIIIGIVECVLYAIICYQSHLFGEIIKVMLISVPLNIVSVVNWIKTSKKQQENKYKNESQVEEDINIKRLTKKGVMGYAISAVVISVLSYFFLKYALGQTTALILGAIALMMTIIGKIMIAQKYMDTWIVYVISDLICISMWVQTLLTTDFMFSNITMIIYYCACLSNDAFAFFYWKSLYRKVKVNGGVLLSKRIIKINSIAKVKRRFKSLVWKKSVDLKNHKKRKNAANSR